MAIWMIWSGYDNLKVFRRAAFWEFRYFIFTLGQAKKKLPGRKPTAQ
jgi:hypothetical protein